MQQMLSFKEEERDESAAEREELLSLLSVVEKEKNCFPSTF